MRDLQIISSSFRSHAKKHFHWTLPHFGGYAAVFLRRPVFLQRQTDHCKPHKGINQIKHIYTLSWNILQTCNSIKTRPLLLELDLSFLMCLVIIQWEWTTKLKPRRLLAFHMPWFHLGDGFLPSSWYSPVFGIYNENNVDNRCFGWHQCLEE